MRRRGFITFLGGAAAWPVTTVAQQRGRVPVVGVLWHAGSADAEGPYYRGCSKDSAPSASYGTDFVAITRRAAMYADKIIKGTKPSDLPIEAPTRFELLINLKTAKAIGIEIPTIMLTRADE